MKINYFLSRIIKKMRGSSIIDSRIDRSSKVESGCQLVNVTMDKHSFCGYDCTLINCVIGSFCSISNGVVIGGGMHPINWVSTSPVFYKGRDSVKKKFSVYERDEPKKTYIGHDVWIGEKVLIKQGINIGNGAVIGMGSIVTKDVQPYEIVAGNPAKVIRKRFSDDIIYNLNIAKWWLLSEDELNKYAKYIKEPQKFIERINQNNGTGR